MDSLRSFGKAKGGLRRIQERISDFWNVFKQVSWGLSDFRRFCGLSGMFLEISGFIERMLEDLMTFKGVTGTIKEVSGGFIELQEHFIGILRGFRGLLPQ